MSTASAPVEIGEIALTVHDLDGVADFYRRVIGLEGLSGSGDELVLGVGSLPLVTLRRDRAARRAGRGEAGLFHTAFLMPSRAALAGWLVHAAGLGVRLEGASDHLVSEAIYLSDPEGNGIEVYADRPRAGWLGPDGAIRMATERLDLNALARAADGAWAGAPDGSVIGHVHLQAGAVPEAEAFWNGVMGFEIAAHYPGAAFFGSGGYHHHIAANTWNSRGAGQRDFPCTGLAELVLLADAASHDGIVARLGGASGADPWGTPVTLRRKPA
jgi:catechol 2,3-dioxygenase